MCYLLLKKIKEIYIAITLIIASLISPSVALADYQALSLSGNPLTSDTAPYLVLSGLTGQSACSISVLAPFSGSISVEGLYQNTTNAQWTASLTVYSPDGTVTTGTTITTAGSYIFNCGTMSAIRADGTATTGTPTVALNASGGINAIARFHSEGNGSKSSQLTTSGTSPWEATFTFGTPYVTPPICVATCFSSMPLTTIATIVSESTSSVTIFDSSHTGATYNVQCTNA